jgi:hypothetical protein
MPLNKCKQNCRSASHGQKKFKRMQFLDRSAKVLPSIQIPPPEKYHMIFSLLLDPRYISLKHLLDLNSHQYIYNLDNKITYLTPHTQQMKEKLLDYIAAVENAANPIPESSCGESIHLHEIQELFGDATTSDSQGTPLENIKSATNEEL